MSIEIWKDVPNYEGLYQVSDVGRFKSLARIVRNNRPVKERIMKQKLDDDGYLQIKLSKDNKSRTFLSHRLVMLAFVGSCPKSMEVNHKDGIKTNNRLGNLEYVTPKENMEHAEQFGLIPHAKGEQILQSKLTESNVLAIRAAIESGVIQKVLAQQYHVSRTAISDLVRRRTWKHI